jgi:hypothetical protein
MVHLSDINYDMPDLASPVSAQARAKPVPAPVVDLPDTEDIVALCQAATPATTRALVSIALDVNEPSPARIAAIKEINDRGYGKAAQAIKGNYQFQLVVTTGVNAAPVALPVLDGAALIACEPSEPS